MRLFSSDFIRNFGIGFIAGAVLVVGANAEDWSGDLASAAKAAELHHAPQPAAEFVIVP